MCAKRLSRKKIKQDELATIVDKTLQFIQRYKRHIIIGVIAIVIAAIATISIIKVFQIQDQRALVILDQALEQYHKEEPDTKDALKLFNKVLGKYRRTSSASRALFYVGNCYFSLEDNEKALDAYRKFIRTYPQHMLYPMAQESIGYCLEKQGKYEQAAEEFKKILDIKEAEYYHPLALINAARCFEQIKNQDKASECYEEIVNKFPSHEFFSRAQQRLRFLKMSQN